METVEVTSFGFSHFIEVISFKYILCVILFTYYLTERLEWCKTCKKVWVTLGASVFVLLVFVAFHQLWPDDNEIKMRVYAEQLAISALIVNTLYDYIVKWVFKWIKSFFTSKT